MAALSFSIPLILRPSSLSLDGLENVVYISSGAGAGTKTGHPFDPANLLPELGEVDSLL